MVTLVRTLLQQCLGVSRAVPKWMGPNLANFLEPCFGNAYTDVEDGTQPPSKLVIGISHLRFRALNWGLGRDSSIVYRRNRKHERQVRIAGMAQPSVEETLCPQDLFS